MCAYVLARVCLEHSFFPYARMPEFRCLHAMKFMCAEMWVFCNKIDNFAPDARRVSSHHNENEMTIQNNVEYVFGTYVNKHDNKFQFSLRVLMRALSKKLQLKTYPSRRYGNRVAMQISATWMIFCKWNKPNVFVTQNYSLVMGRNASQHIKR